MANLVTDGARFSKALGAEIERSIINIPNKHATTASVGTLYPCFFHDIIPGSRFKIDAAMTSIMQPSIFPTLDNIVCDVSFFFVPYRIIWSNFKKFMGETEPSEYEDSQNMVMPYFSFSSQGSYPLNSTTTVVGDIYDRMGVREGIKIAGCNSLPYRAYRLIWNEWYRNPSIQNSLLINRGDIDDEYIPYNLKVNRFKDYYSSALPNPQVTADPVIIPLTGLARVLPETDVLSSSVPVGTDSLAWRVLNGTTLNLSSSGSLGSISDQTFISSSSGSSVATNVIPANLAVNFDNQLNAIGSTVTALRQAVAMQRYLEIENSARRYREMLLGHFGVSALDKTMQIPEFLGGARFKINMNANVQTSANSGDQAAGSLSGVSITKDRSFSVGDTVFTEHGCVIGVFSLRVLNHLYQQGSPRFFFKKTKFDLYSPEFAHLSNQPIYKGELYLDNYGFDMANSNSDNFDVFGYTEAWNEYRMIPSRISGQLRKTYNNEINYPWTYADYYESAPTLSESWLVEPRENVDNTLAYVGQPISRPDGLDSVYDYPFSDPDSATIQTQVPDQFIVRFEFNIDAEQPLPLYSIPGGGDL